MIHLGSKNLIFKDMKKKTVIEQMIGLLRTPIALRKGINIPPDECLIWASELEKEFKELVEQLNEK